MVVFDNDLVGGFEEISEIQGNRDGPNASVISGDCVVPDHYTADDLIGLIWFYVDGTWHVRSANMRKNVVFEGAVKAIDDTDSVSIFVIGTFEYIVYDFDFRV